MKKVYIRDDGVVRGCASNISKMNPFEYAFYKTFYWGAYKTAFRDLASEALNFVSAIISVPLLVFMIIFMPVVQFVCGIFKIKDSKKIMVKIKK